MKLPRPGADRHDDDCGFHDFEPCDCAKAIVTDVTETFRADLKEIFNGQRKEIQ